MFLNKNRLLVVMLILAAVPAISSARVASARVLDAGLHANDTRQRIGVINPYALAELVAGHKIHWKNVSDIPRLLEEKLQFPYEKLFDPKHKGPLYTGFALDRNILLKQARSPLLDIEKRGRANDLDFPRNGEHPVIMKLGDLAHQFNATNVRTIGVQEAHVINGYYLQLKVRLPEEDRLRRLGEVLTPKIVRTIAFDPTELKRGASDPCAYHWEDPGRFFNETAEFFDPVQGSVANCGLIAALSAVAWARPRKIKHVTRATGEKQEQFTNMIKFYRPDGSGTVVKRIEVTDSIPLSSGRLYIYARSVETGEIWPAIYEKAYAKFLSDVAHDCPFIPETAGLDPIVASAVLTGWFPHIYSTNVNVFTIIAKIQQNSYRGRTFYPMTAYTYATAEAADKDGKNVVYNNANIVANHAYTILGWEFRYGHYYVILRNPWGLNDPNSLSSTLGGTWVAWDISWYRPIDLADPDGVFALEVSAFKRYFVKFGVAK